MNVSRNEHAVFVRGELFYGTYSLLLTYEEAQELADKINQMLLDYELESKDENKTNG